MYQRLLKQVRKMSGLSKKTIGENCWAGHKYALDVIDGKITSCAYIYAACERYLEDIERTTEFEFRWDTAERFLRLFQKFEHVIGEWDTPNIVLEPWQKFLFLNVELFYWKLPEKKGKRRYKSAHLEVARGNGKALCLETPIPTPTGMKRLGDLSVGDKVFGRDGRVCTIINETPIHTPSQYKVTLANGLEILASGNHEWYTTTQTERDRKARHDKRDPRKQKNVSYVYESIRTTDEIFETQTVCSRKDSNHHIKITKPVQQSYFGDLLVKPWALGYWLGNGTTGRGSSTCAAKDAQYLMDYFIEDGYTASLKYSGANNSASIKTVGLQPQLGEIGVLYDKHIPQEYLSASISDRLELLRGLLDSDGSIDSRANRGRIEFCSVHEAFARQVHRLVCGLGFKASCKRYKVHSNFETHSKYHWDVTFTPLVDFPLFKLKRKSELQVEARSFTSTDKQVIRKVENIATEDRVPMKCIEVDSRDHSYLITDYHIPTHNSCIASCTGLIYLNLIDVVKGNKVYSCATKKEQARIVLDSAREMAKANQSYLDNTGAEVYAHHIAHEPSGSEFKALSSDSKSLDGLQPVLAIIDELHAHRDRAVFDVIDTAMSKRKDSFMLVITTAGFSLDGIGYSQSQYAKKVALGEIDDDSFFSLVFTLDEDDDWKDSKNWLKANPNWGISVDPDTFKSKALKAQVNRSDEINFKVKHLNLWQNEFHQYYSVKKWDKLGNPNLKIEQFKDAKCYVGVDLASKVDLTAFAYLFKDEETGMFTLFADNFCPEATVKSSKNNNYPIWVKDGHLIATQGEAINYLKLRKDFLEKEKNLQVMSVAYDSWNATEFSQQLTKARVDVTEFRMNTSNLSEPMKRLESIIREGKIQHDGNPLVSWCLSNVVAKPDAADNVFPRKDHDDMKIDIVIGILMALGMWIQREEEQSCYERRDIRIL